MFKALLVRALSGFTNNHLQTRNSKLAAPHAVLNFLFLVCKLVLANCKNARTKSAAKVLLLSLSKPLK